MSVMFTHNLGNVWSRSASAANGVLDARHTAWMTPTERVRAERLRQAHMLFSGHHRHYYLDEGRTSYPYPSLRENQPPYFRPYNLLTLVAEKMADLLFGESPRLYIDHDATQQVINNIAERSWLYGMVIDMAAECCWAGETFFEVTRQGGLAYIGHALAQQVWPQGVPGVDQQHARYIRYATALVTEETTQSMLLLETHYTAGLIERRLYRLEENNVTGPKRSDDKLSLDKWPQRTVAGEPLADQEQTGLSRPSIIRIPNGFGARSDYDGLIELQDSLHAANTQIGRVLAKHADPKLAAPEAAVNPDTGNLPASAEVYFFRSKDEVPQYITWNAELASAMEDRKFALSALATVAEMPLSLLGVKDDSTVESAAKMRLAATPALAKATRKSVIWRQAIRMAISLAIESETGFTPAIPIGVEMRDGLPDDEVERATTIATLRGARVMSRVRALQQQWLDPGTVREELKRLEEEDAQQTPSIFFGNQAVAGSGAGQ